MMHELDIVALLERIPQFGLEPGDIGTIVMVHAGGSAYEVEFATLAGETLAVLTLPAASVRPLRQREIANGREVA